MVSRKFRIQVRVAEASIPIYVSESEFRYYLGELKGMGYEVASMLVEFGKLTKFEYYLVDLCKEEKVYIGVQYIYVYEEGKKL